MVEEKKECLYIGQTAIYKGPFKSVNDDEDHTFERGIPQEICTDTADKLERPPYKGMFIITEPKSEGGEPCCPPGEC